MVLINWENTTNVSLLDIYNDNFLHTQIRVYHYEYKTVEFCCCATGRNFT